MPAMQAVVKVLESEGVEVVFGIPGAAILPLYKALAIGPSGPARTNMVTGLYEVLIEREADAAMGPALDKIREFDNAQLCRELDLPLQRVPLPRSIQGGARRGVPVRGVHVPV